MLRFNISGSSHLEFGPTFRYRNIDNTPGRITDEEASFFTEDALANRKYIGSTVRHSFDFVDNRVFPTNGFSFSASGTFLMEPFKNENVTELNLETKMYVQLLVRPKLVIANKIGFMTTYGDQQFYHFPAIGNNAGLRGYRNERFRGTAAFYNNIDLRLKLLTWNNSVIPMDVGLLGGYDLGKVYLNDGLENPWHSSHTIGIWFELLEAMVLQPYYSINEEQNTFSLQLGFSF
jgi:outer membrane protein assembly factor BamA